MSQPAKVEAIQKLSPTEVLFIERLILAVEKNQDGFRDRLRKALGLNATT